MARVSKMEADRATAAVRERLADQQKTRTAIAIEPALLDRYVGRYQLMAHAGATVSREADQLFIAFGAQGAVEVFPESDHKFFWKGVARQISFAGDHAILHQVGRLIPLARVAQDEPAERISA